MNFPSQVPIPYICLLALMQLEVILAENYAKFSYFPAKGYY